MDKTYIVTFSKHFDPTTGETDDYPTDDLNLHGLYLVSFEYDHSEEPLSGSEYGVEVWRYEVDASEADAFEERVSRTTSVISYR